MSFLDRLIATVTPPESEETRMEARRNARQSAIQGSWFAQVIDEHERIERAFAAVRNAPDPQTRKEATRDLASLLTAHANAEESIIYPEMADTGHKTHTSMAYEEQAMTKVQLALLEKIEPMSQDYIEKLEHIRGAVTHHMYQEESNWFPELQSQLPEGREMHVAARFREEVRCYLGDQAPSSGQPLA